MRRYSYILLPYRGDPVTTVWLPRNREMDSLVVRIRLGDISSSGQQKAKRLGLTKAEVMILGSFQKVITLVVRVAPGQVPRGLQEVSIKEALRHTLFGPIVRAIQTTQVR